MDSVSAERCFFYWVGVILVMSEHRPRMINGIDPSVSGSLSGGCSSATLVNRVREKLNELLCVGQTRLDWFSTLVKSVCETFFSFTPQNWLFMISGSLQSLVFLYNLVNEWQPADLPDSGGQTHRACFTSTRMFPMRSGRQRSDDGGISPISRSTIWHRGSTQHQMRSGHSTQNYYEVFIERQRTKNKTDRPETESAGALTSLINWC